MTARRDATRRETDAATSAIRTGSAARGVAERDATVSSASRNASRGERRIREIGRTLRALASNGGQDLGCDSIGDDITGFT
jgi:hypothetical protein